MIFSIRDDDTNYFTSPSDLEEAYSSIWEICPVTLFLVPYIKGNWKYWVRERYFNYKNLDFDEYKNDNKIYPIGENKDLVDFLKNKIKQGQVELGIHGIHHKNLEKNLPQIKSNRVENAEFLTHQNLTQKLAEAKKYLENIFEQTISVFSPPQNLINSNGANAIKKCNLSIVRNRATKKVFQNFHEIGIENSIKILNHSIQKSFFKNSSNQYPNLLKINNTIEIPHYPFQPLTNLNDLKKNLKMIKRNNGIFVISTHYYALQKSFDPNLNMKSELLTLIKELNDDEGISFVGLNSLVKKTNENTGSRL